MKLTSLFSGSSGNCILLQGGEANILIDAGLSGSRIREMIAQADVALEDIDAILVTHEHDDHIAGVGVLARRYGMPVWSNEQTFMAMRGKLGKIKDDTVRLFDSGRAFTVNGLNILPYRTSHDAAEPVGFLFDDGKAKAALLTDTGVITAAVADTVRGAKSVFIESNHDVDMLLCGRYPEVLKRRILSDSGHLSNDDCALFLADLIENGCEKMCLGHLSAENNTPLAALNTTVSFLASRGIVRGSDYIINIARRDGITDSMDC